MNILIFLYQDTYVGGAENVLKQIAGYYLSRRDDVYVLFLREKKFGHWEIRGEEKLHLFYGRGVVEFISNLYKLHKVKFSYSYSSLVDFTGILGIMKRLHILNINKMIGRESTAIFERYTGVGLWRKKMMYRLGYPAVDFLICQTSYMKSELFKHLPWIFDKCTVKVIPNPVDVEEMNIKGQDNKEKIIAGDYLVTAGRFIQEKGYDILIDAFAVLREKHKELKLVILGDGIKRKELEEQIEKADLKDGVLMPGASPNVYPWFKNAKACVISSRVEGFPNVLLQMMSQNTRVVSTLCAGDIEKLKGIVTCPPNSIEGLTKAIEIALEDNNDELIRTQFDSELKCRSIENFIRTVEDS